MIIRTVNRGNHYRQARRATYRRAYYERRQREHDIYYGRRAIQARGDEFAPLIEKSYREQEVRWADGN